MPSKNIIKLYIENSYYHIYNRGVEKRKIFLDEQDFGVFLSYLKDYLTEKDVDRLNNVLQYPNSSYVQKDKAQKLLRMNNFYEEITLLAYCLMPNHFHFFINQKSAQSIEKFMQSIATRYTMYFNRKYKRVGFLYQSTYKAVLIDSEEQFIYLSKYIHKQAVIHQGLTLQGEKWVNKYPSSYPEYLGLRKTEWVHPEEVLTYFSKTNPNLSYESFVNESDDFTYLEHRILEDY